MRNLSPYPTYDVILALIYGPSTHQAPYVELFVWESPCRFRSTCLVVFLLTTFATCLVHYMK